MPIRTVDNLPPKNILFKMNTQCAETDNIAMYRRVGDDYIRNEYYKVATPLQYLPDLRDPFDHIQLYRQWNRCPYREYPQALMPIHEPTLARHFASMNPSTGATFNQYSVTAFDEPFNLADVLIEWALSNHNANVNYTEFPTPRRISQFVIFSRSIPSRTLRVYTLNPNTGLREPIEYDAVGSQCALLGCNGGLYAYRVLNPPYVSNLFLEYTDVSFLQAYQLPSVAFTDLLYFEDYPDRQLPLSVALRTKRTINTECSRDLAVFGTPNSGLLFPLIPLFNNSYEPSGFALIEKYVKNGVLQSFTQTQSVPNRIRFTCMLPKAATITAMEFIMSVPILPEKVPQPASTSCIYPQTVLIEGRQKETDAWSVLDELTLDLFGNGMPNYFTKFHYLTYRRPIKEVRFTVQSIANYTPMSNNRYSIARTHFYFPQVRCFG